MEVDIKLNVNTCVLLGVIGVLGHSLYKLAQKNAVLADENKALKEAKGEAIM